MIRLANPDYLVHQTLADVLKPPPRVEKTAKREAKRKRLQLVLAILVPPPPAKGR
jgi:hypothetical protein